MKVYIVTTCDEDLNGDCAMYINSVYLDKDKAEKCANSLWHGSIEKYEISQ